MPAPRQLPALGALGALGLIGWGPTPQRPHAHSDPSATADHFTQRRTAACATPAAGPPPAPSASWLQRALPLAASLRLPLGLTCLAEGPSSAPPPPPPPAAASGGPGGSGGYDNGDGDDDGDDVDTITGVFHRLDPARAQLRLVQVVFRHGARTPLSKRSDLWQGVQWDVCGEAYKAAAVRLFSTAGVENPLNKSDQRQRATILDGGCRKGELTLVGQAQALELGRRLRATYVDEYGLLPPTLQEGVVVARTTNVARTIATLRGVLTGLYPQQQQEEAREPMRVTTAGDLDEILYADTRACPHLASFKALSAALGKAAVRADPDHAWVVRQVAQLTGMDEAAVDADPWIITDVHDVLTSLAAHGKPLPPAFAQQPQLVQAVNRLATKEFTAEVAPSLRDSVGRTVLRLSMGRLLHTLTANMHPGAAAAAAAAPGGSSSSSSSSSSGDGSGSSGGSGGSSSSGDGSGSGGAGPRMFMYSGHDSTLMPLLSALGVEVVSWPPYLSNLVFELWEVPPPPARKGQPQQAGAEAAPRFAVRVLFNGEELPLPACPPGYLPSLQTFEQQVVGPFLLSAARYGSACAVEVAHDSSMPTTQPPKGI